MKNKVYLLMQTINDYGAPEVVEVVFKEFPTKEYFVEVMSKQGSITVGDFWDRVADVVLTGRVYDCGYGNSNGDSWYLQEMDLF